MIIPLISSALFTLFVALIARFKKTTLQILCLLSAFVGAFLIAHFLRLPVYYVPIALLLVVFLLQIVAELLSPVLLDYPRTESTYPVSYHANRVLVIVPHQDDEINLMAGLYEALLAQCEVFVAFFTTGDAAADNGKERMKEAIRSLGVYGFREDHIIFLGYGNRWQGPEKHIYHANSSSVLRSFSGKKKTYALDDHPPFHECEYTRQNAVNDFIVLIDSIRPDLIFASDCDWHEDHRAMSLLLDEAMGILLKSEENYRPTVLKGFAYDYSWTAVSDFYQVNLSGSVEKPGMDAFPFYPWDDRITIPVEYGSLSRRLEHCIAYRALRSHRSQLAEKEAVKVVNGDRCFWQRRTDNLLLSGNCFISASSGETAYLNDFKLVDYSDITVRDAATSRIGWCPSPDDDKRVIQVSFSATQHVAEIVFYECSFPNSGTTPVWIGTDSQAERYDLSLGGKSVIRLDTETKNIRISFPENVPVCLSELEVFQEPDPILPFRVIKLGSVSGEYLYDYWVERNETICIVPLDEHRRCVNDSRCILKQEQDDLSSGKHGISISRKTGKTIIVSIQSDDLLDCIAVSWPGKATLAVSRFLTWFERQGYTFEGEIRTYKQLFRNLFVGMGLKKG